MHGSVWQYCGFNGYDMSFNCSFKMTPSSILLLLLLQLISLAHAQNQTNGSCVCDRLVTVATFQTGVCGRAARCYWELAHLSRALKGDCTLQKAYKKKITQALSNIPTYKIHKNNTDPKDIYQIFDSEKLDIENTTFDDYPMPTHYTERVDGVVTILPGIQKCIEMETSCTQELEKEIRELCITAMTEEGIKKIQDSINVKIREHIVYKITKDPQAVGTAQLNKCNLRVLARRKKGSGKYEDEWILNELYPRLRPPYFDLYLLYMLDPLDNMKGLPIEDRWWNETKAIHDLPNFMPFNMTLAIHTAIKHIYDGRQGDKGRGKAYSLEWRPEKFCWSSSIFVCMDLGEWDTKNENCEILAARRSQPNSPAPAPDSSESPLALPEQLPADPPAPPPDLPATPPDSPASPPDPPTPPENE